MTGGASRSGLLPLLPGSGGVDEDVPLPAAASRPFSGPDGWATSGAAPVDSAGSFTLVGTTLRGIRPTRATAHTSAAGSLRVLSPILSSISDGGKPGFAAQTASTRAPHAPHTRAVQ